MTYQKKKGWEELVEEAACQPREDFDDRDRAILAADAVIKRATDAKELTDRFGVDGRALSRWLKEGKP